MRGSRGIFSIELQRVSDTPDLRRVLKVIEDAPGSMVHDKD
jgi:hypothetical protein